jgi:hypothetical protein
MTTATHEHRQSTSVLMGECLRCRRPARLEGEARQRDTRPPCPACGGRISATAQLQARRNLEPCNGVCMGARGPRCDCSCGGENHGASWAIGGAVLPLF